MATRVSDAADLLQVCGRWRQERQQGQGASNDDWLIAPLSLFFSFYCGACQMNDSSEDTAKPIAIYWTFSLSPPSPTRRLRQLFR